MTSPDTKETMKKNIENEEELKEHRFVDLPDEEVTIASKAPFVSKQSYERYSLSYLKALADFYGIDRSDDSEIVKADKNDKPSQSNSGELSIIFDKVSNISIDDQKAYLELFQKYSKQVVTDKTPEKMLEVQRLADLHSKISVEQEQFIKYMKENYANRNDIYDNLHLSMKRYVKELSLSKLNLSLKYPCWYKYEQIIQFWTQEKILKENPISFTLDKVLLSLGLVPRLVLPISNLKCVLPRDYYKVIKRFPSKRNEVQDPHPSKMVCSQDIIALSLAKKIQADVILSLSSFKTLLLLPPYENNWELMVTVEGQENGKKMVIVDKPFCLGQRRCRDQLYRFCKYASRVQFSHFNPGQAKKSEMAAKRKLIVHDEDEIFKDEKANNSDLDLEVFGLVGASPPKKTSKIEEAVEKLMEDEKKMDEENTKDENVVACSETIKDIVDEIERGNVEESLAKSQEKEVLKVELPLEKTEIETELEVTDPKMNIPKTRERDSSESESESLVIDLDKIQLKPCDNDESKNLNDTDSVFEPSTEDDEDDLPLKFHLKGQTSRVIATRSKTKLNTNKDEVKNKMKSTEIDESKDSDNIEPVSPSKISPQSPTPSNCGENEMRPPTIFPLHEEFAEINDPVSVETETTYPPVSPSDNIRYSLFSLSNLKILFRGKTDALKPPISTPFMIYPKVEYFSEYAAEEVTPRELCNQWAMLATHPGSQLLRVRLNQQHFEQIMMEELTMDTLLQSPDALKLRLKPANALNQMHFMLENFLSLTPGHYYLCHKQNESVATLYKESEKKSLNLHSLIASRLADVEDGNLFSKDSNWVNLDPGTLLPPLIKMNKVPALFPQKGPKKSSPISKSKASRKKASRGKKGKKNS